MPLFIAITVLDKIIFFLVWCLVQASMIRRFLAPVPILMLHIIEALVQAYIFGILALMYVAGGIQSQQLRQQKQGVTHA